MVACGQRSGRARCRNVGGKPGIRTAVGEVAEHPLHRRAGAGAVNYVIPEFAELIEDDVHGIMIEYRACIVDFFDVTFRAWCAYDVGWIDDPFFKPLKPFAAHVFRQYGDAATAKNSGDCHSAAAKIPGRGPNGAVSCRIELTARDTRNQTAKGSQDLMCSDHRETISKQQHDARLHARQLL